MNKAAFIDRDGVINEDREFVHRSADFHFIPGSIEALRVLRAAGYRLVVITNQSGIGRRLFSEADYLELESYMRARLEQAGVVLDGIEYCPHAPGANCECRKPRPGMLLTAMRKLDIEPSQSVLVGDRRADIEAGRAAAVRRCFLVQSGKKLTAGDLQLADGVYPDLAACVAALLRSDS
jgi:D-glycero-D-manno-heptose 1,7-bisphosphate phosphatase